MSFSLSPFNLNAIKRSMIEINHTHPCHVQRALRPIPHAPALQLHITPLTQGQPKQRMTIGAILIYTPGSR
jgi:hypothetical protein